MLAQIIRRFGPDESGATAIEYALIGTLIAVALVASLTAFGDGLGNLFGAGPDGASQVIARQVDRMG